MRIPNDHLPYLMFKDGDLGKICKNDESCPYKVKESCRPRTLVLLIFEIFIYYYWRRNLQIHLNVGVTKKVAMIGRIAF